MNDYVDVIPFIMPILALVLAGFMRDWGADRNKQQGE